MAVNKSMEPSGVYYYLWSTATRLNVYVESHNYHDVTVFISDYSVDLLQNHSSITCLFHFRRILQLRSTPNSAFLKTHPYSGETKLNHLYTTMFFLNAR